MNALKARLKALLSARDYEEIERLLDAPDDDPDTGTPQAADGFRYAMDSATPTRAVAEMLAAIDETAPVVGRHVVLAQNSAAAVFRAALVAMGVDAATVHPSGLPLLFRTVRRRQRDGDSQPAPVLTGAARAAFAKEHPYLARIRIL
jgi:hypothetical protein